MARGFVATPEASKNFLLTQYVATRWYRAPELIFGMQDYSAAVDMWSVGCIFAEMLGRKQLFPGRNWLHQLDLIVSLRGTPGHTYIHMIESEQFRNIIKAFPVREAVPLHTVYPQSNSTAHSLLDAMLRWDPQKRVTSANSLSHPFLAKYHDGDDEPICIPVFNFDFEKKGKTSRAEIPELREAISKEIQDYNQPSATLSIATIDLRPVSKDELKTTAVLSPPKQSHIPENSTLAEFLKKSQKKISSDVVSCEPVVVLGLDAFLKQKSGMDTGSSFPSETTVCAQLPPNVTMVNLLPSGDSKQNKSTLTKISMSVNTNVESSDIEMLSAGKSPDIRNVDMMAVKEEITDEKKLDPKALLKEAILRAGIRRQQQKLENGSKNRPVTAQQRMKEREERKKKKRDNAKEKKKRKERDKSNPTALELTEEDKNMLERWKGMQNEAQLRLNQQTGSRSTHSPVSMINTSQDSTQSARGQSSTFSNLPSHHGYTSLQQLGANAPPHPLVIQHGTQSHTVISSNQIQAFTTTSLKNTPSLYKDDIHKTLRGGVTKTLLSPPNLAAASSADLHSMLVQRDQRFDKLSEFLQELSPETQNTGLQRQGVEIYASSDTGLPKVCSFNAVTLPSYQQAIVDKVFPQMSHTVNENHMTLTESGQAGARHLQSNRAPDQSKHLVGPSTKGSNMSPFYLNDLLRLSSDSDQSDTTGTYSARQNELKEGSSKFNCESSNKAVKPNIPGISIPSTSRLPHELLGQSSLPVTHGAATHGAGSLIPEGSDWLQMLAKQMSKSHVDDLTLARTPKGTGSGYGVGIDINAIVQETMMETQNESGYFARPDSAPLSASLIADWLELRGGVNGADLEALSREIELASPILLSDLNT